MPNHTWPTAKLTRFRGELLNWFAQQQRDLPWRRTSDPYAIWVSEIMLQQTRVAAAIPYFERFVERFPKYQALAEASEEEVLRYWSGLGYYYRARNMRKAAARMCELGGFPSEYEGILALPGVGEYTAAAVASIAFGLPYAVVDGNVVRVVSRLMAEDAGRKGAGEAARLLLDADRPGGFNQAMMELGATVCLPKNPQCLLCPVAAMCRAREMGRQREFPAAKAKSKNLVIERDLFWVERSGRILAWKRTPGDRLMVGFWELPEREQLPSAVAEEQIGKFRHGITVHSYRIRVWRADAPGADGNCEWVDICKLVHMPISTIFKKALKIVENQRKISYVSSASVGN